MGTGKGMLIENEAVAVDAQGRPVVRMVRARRPSTGPSFPQTDANPGSVPLGRWQVSGTFVRGMGGFGGEKQPKQPAYDPPARPADKVEESATTPHQAMIYRLSGYGRSAPPVRAPGTAAHESSRARTCV